MQPSEIAKEINKLDISEKLSLISTVWDDIARQSGALPLPEWQKQELERRLQAYEHGDLKTHDVYSVHEGIRQQYKTD